MSKSFYTGISKSLDINSSLLKLRRETPKYIPMSNDTFKWNDGLVKDMIYRKLPIPEHYWNNLQKCLDEFKASHTPKKEDAGRERDWEITSLKYLTNGEIYPFSVIPTDDKFIIYSVRRLSDGVVFSVGDQLVKWGKIVSFKIQCDKWMLAVFDRPDIPAHVFIEDFEKLPPERSKLFTTEDGVDVYENDRVWFVNYLFKIDFYDFVDNKTGHRELELKHFPGIYKYFSTEEKAKEYVNMNKPCLSVNDVVHNVFNIEYEQREQLKELAKSKLST